MRQISRIPKIALHFVNLLNALIIYTRLSMISYCFRLKINDTELKKTKELSWSSPPGGVSLYTKYYPKPYNHPQPIIRLIWSVKNWRQTETQSVRLVNWIKHLIVAFVLYLHARVELNNNANRREKNPSPDPDSDGPLIKSEPQHMCTKKKKNYK